MNELALFAGAGGGILGGHLLGWQTVCAVEWEAYPASVLCARQNDGLLPPFPIWDDIQTFDGRPWRGIVDVVSGGFPCQDISAAGRGDGLDGERSGMWHHMARVVGEVRPSYVFVENSPMLTTRGGTRVIADLTALGYDCRWTVMGAADVGANHQRDRIWILAYANSMRELQQTRSKRDERDGVSDSSETMADANGINRRGQSFNESCSRERSWDQPFGRCDEMADTDSQRQQGQQWSTAPRQTSATCGCGKEISNSYATRLQVRNGSAGSAWSLSTFEQCDWWNTEPDVGRVANGVAARVDRLKAIGNGQVPRVAATAFNILRSK